MTFNVAKVHEDFQAASVARVPALQSQEPGSCRADARHLEVV